MHTVSFSIGTHSSRAAAAFLALSLVCVSAWGDVINDPAGDTLAPGPDITSLSTSLIGANQSTLQISVNFAGPIFAPSSFNLNSLGGYILLDMNGDANMPASAASLLSQPPPPAGIDFFIDLFSEEFLPGNVDLLDANKNFVANLPITFGASSFSIAAPVSVLGAANPAVGIVVGTFDRPTDLAAAGPDQAPVPEPGSLVLFLAMAGAGATAWQIRAGRGRRSDGSQSQ